MIGVERRPGAVDQTNAGVPHFSELPVGMLSPGWSVWRPDSHRAIKTRRVLRHLHHHCGYAAADDSLYEANTLARVAAFIGEHEYSDLVYGDVVLNQRRSATPAASILTVCCSRRTFAIKLLLPPQALRHHWTVQLTLSDMRRLGLQYSLFFRSCAGNPVYGYGGFAVQRHYWHEPHRKDKSVAERLPLYLWVSALTRGRTREGRRAVLDWYLGVPYQSVPGAQR